MTYAYLSKEEKQNLIKNVVDGMGLEAMRAYISSETRSWLESRGSRGVDSLPDVITNTIRETIKEMSLKVIKEMKEEIAERIKERIREMPPDELIVLIRVCS